MDYDHEIPEAPVRETLQERRTRVLPLFRMDYDLSAHRAACLHDRGTLHPDFLDDYRAIIGEITPPPKPSPISPPPRRPTAAAMCACSVILVLLECVLVALKVGGAISWDWGWVLAPVLIPSFIATVMLVVTGIALAAMDERDAARRRSA